VVEDNLAADNQPEDAAAQAQPFPRVAPPESRFLFVDVAALRAKQLRRGARPRLAGSGDPGVEVSAEHPRKPERVAMEEVRQGLVIFDIPEVKPEPTGDEQ
jgi:DNA-directed RNA polymerase subunit K/omega